jgi:hypothetical protein
VFADPDVRPVAMISLQVVGLDGKILCTCKRTRD